MLKSAAATQAGKMVAAEEDNLATKVITVNSPKVADAANEIAKALPEAAKIAGVTPEQINATLSTLIVGEIGKLQAAGTTNVNPPATK